MVACFLGRNFCIQIRKPKQIYIHALMAPRMEREEMSGLEGGNRHTPPAVSQTILAYISTGSGFYFVHFLKRSKWRNFCIRQRAGNRRHMGVPKSTTELGKVHATHPKIHTHTDRQLPTHTHTHTHICCNDNRTQVSILGQIFQLSDKTLHSPDPCNSPCHPCVYGVGCVCVCVWVLSMASGCFKIYI